MEFLDHPIPAAAHDAMHVQHKYWSRKPINVVRAHIEASTRPGDIVLDPFCGSGTTISQSLITGRKAVGFDLNPMAIFITRNTVERASIQALFETHESIQGRVREKIQSLYRTRCHECLDNSATETICIHWKVHHPTKIIYTCKNCNKSAKKLKKFTKIPDAEDLNLIAEIKGMDVENWHPDDIIPEGMVFNQARRVVTRFSELFTKRNLIALSILFNEIESLPFKTSEERKIKQLFEFSFTSMVHLCSKMTPIRPSRPYSSFWATNSYWLPRKFMESNVWQKYESAILGPQGLLASKRLANKKLSKDITFVETFDELSKNDATCAFLMKQDATTIQNRLPPNSIDYIFTDPPYAGSIPYLELSTLWALWLKLGGDINFNEEILIDEPRGKDFAFFQQKLEDFFKNAYAVLKPGKILTFTYHNLDMKVRRTILGAPLKSGFILESIIYQPPPRPSPAHTLRPFNSAIGDYIVHFRKPTDETSHGEKEIPAERVKKTKKEIEKELVDLVVEIIKNCGKPVAFTEIVNHLDVQLANKNWFFTHDLDPRKLLKKYKNEIFLMKKEVIGSKNGFKWWLTGDLL
ncbi:MAG: DNA methyltransferase [Candidatus Hodarchaeota archaeon]